MYTPQKTAAPVKPGVDAPGGDRCNPSITTVLNGDFTIMAQTTDAQHGGSQVTSKATTHTRADVPLPAGFVAPDEWEPSQILSHGETRSWRLVYSADRKVTDHDACVSVRATQYSDGSLDDVEILANGADSDDPLNSDQARELASALIEAAAEVDRLVQS
jgi:hypothetical protein